MPTYEELLQENSELRQANGELRQRVEEQGRQIAHLKRQRRRRNLSRRYGAGKRQAAPFSKGDPSEDPKSQGAKPGINMVSKRLELCPITSTNPSWWSARWNCEHCGGQVIPQGEARQYQTDLPPIRPVTTEFILHYGKCSACGREAVGRHPRQTSQAFRVGNVQLGPNVLGLAAWLNKVGGLSYGKIAALLKELAGLSVSRSALCRALLRMSKKLEPLYEELKAKIRSFSCGVPGRDGLAGGGL